MMQETKDHAVPCGAGRDNEADSEELKHGTDEIPLRPERCIECNGCVTACKNEARHSLGREPPPRRGR